jgi:nucleoside-diphosphate-sugar epimerase
MSVSPRVAVFGATGFVGRATTAAIAGQGAEVVPIRTPRLPDMPASAASTFVRDHQDIVADLAKSIAEVSVVVNAAGDPGASSGDESALVAANALVPGLLAAAVSLAGTQRFIHVSSAAVQGARHTLDSTLEVSPFSPYSRSKALGEALVREFAGDSAVIYRPPGVHGADRRVSRMTARIARSRFSSVARPGTSPTPLTLLPNIADAIAFLATTPQQPPIIVAHPWEGLTTSSVLSLLGDRQPVQIPAPLARAVVAALKVAGKAFAPLAGNARRVEMLWFGQGQADSWLTAAGWRPPAGESAWRELGASFAGGRVEPRTVPNE